MGNRVEITDELIVSVPGDLADFGYMVLLVGTGVLTDFFAGKPVTKTYDPARRVTIFES